MTMPAGCNNGTAVHFFDFTIPVDRDWMTNASIFYSVVPWVLALVLIVATVATRRVSLMFLCVYGGVCVFTNEAIIKQAVSQPRPYGTCLTSKGMPSSHSLLSIGFTILIGMELAIHQTAVNWMTRAGGWFVLAVLLVPVPAARVNLHDHSELQVGIGSIEGIVLAFMYFALLHFVVARAAKRWAVLPLAAKTGVNFDYGWPAEVPEANYPEAPGVVLDDQGAPPIQQPQQLPIPGQGALPS